MTQIREFHPAADLFPLLRGVAFQELVEDIRENGLLEPILLDTEGRILDGRNRYRACLKAEVEPRFTEWEGKGSQAELALSLNLYRRHLDESQRALVAARLAKLMETEAVKRKSRHRREDLANLPGLPRGESRERAAAMVNVSSRLIGHAIKVLRDAGEELIAAVESGGLAVSTAAVLAGLPKEEQAQTVAGGAKQAAAKARELRAARPKAEAAGPLPGSFQVIQSHARGEGLVLLCLASSALAEAIEALQARGFRHAG
jgi:ParB-like chromosome segregation protein Spo0J